MTADAYGLAWTIAATGIALNIGLAVCLGRLTSEVAKLRHAAEQVETHLRVRNLMG